jgi:hypothetical protein
MNKDRRWGRGGGFISATEGAGGASDVNRIRCRPLCPAPATWPRGTTRLGEEQRGSAAGGIHHPVGLGSGLKSEYRQFYRRAADVARQLALPPQRSGHRRQQTRDRAQSRVQCFANQLRGHNVADPLLLGRDCDFISFFSLVQDHKMTFLPGDRIAVPYRTAIRRPV